MKKPFKKTPERFNRALTALVQAFFNDTLANGACSACAVGNIVAYAHGVKITKEDIQNIANGNRDNAPEHAKWSFLGITCRMRDAKTNEITKKQYIHNYPVSDKIFVLSRPDQIERALQIIIPTGYSEEEIMRIEYAFESNSEIHIQDYKNHSKKEIMEDQFKGLMAVVEELCKIDDLDAVEYKKAFEYKEDLTPVCG